MKGDIVKLKGEEAKVVAEAVVSLTTRTIKIRICELIPSGIFVVLRNDFIQVSFGDKQSALALYLELIQDEAF